MVVEKENPKSVVPRKNGFYTHNMERGCVQRVCRGEFRITVDARRNSMVSIETYGETRHRKANNADVMRRRIRGGNERKLRIA